MSEERFATAIHGLCAALHIEHVDPHGVVMLLPRDQWWRLWCSLERRYRGMLKFDGRGFEPDHFRYMGIMFKPKDAA